MTESAVDAAVARRSMTRIAMTVLAAAAVWFLVGSSWDDAVSADDAPVVAIASPSAQGMQSASAVVPAESTKEQVGAPTAEQVDALVNAATEELLRPAGSQPTHRDGGAADLTPWSSFPRTQFGLGWYLSCMSPKASAHELLRNVHLNPRDQRIDPRNAEQLDSVLRRYVAPLVGKFNDAMVDAAIMDIDALGAGASWRDANASQIQVPRIRGGADVMSRVPTPTEGPTLVYRTREDGGFDALEANTLPSVRGLKDVRAFFITELGCAIVAWFVAVGALEAHEAEAVRAEVFHQAQQSLR
jgi:hypothetical protein